MTYQIADHTIEYEHEMALRGNEVSENAKKRDSRIGTDQYHMKSESIQNDRKSIESIVLFLNIFGYVGISVMSNVPFIYSHLVVFVDFKWYLSVPIQFCPFFGVFSDTSFPLRWNALQIHGMYHTSNTINEQENENGIYVVSFYYQPRSYTDKRNQFVRIFCQPPYDTLCYAMLCHC